MGPSNVFITQIGIGLFEKAKEASLGRSGGRKKPYKDISRNSSSRAVGRSENRGGGGGEYQCSGFNLPPGWNRDKVIRV